MEATPAQLRIIVLLIAFIVLGSLTALISAGASWLGAPNSVVLVILGLGMAFTVYVMVLVWQKFGDALNTAVDQMNEEDDDQS